MLDLPNHIDEAHTIATQMFTSKTLSEQNEMIEQIKVKLATLRANKRAELESSLKELDESVEQLRKL